MTTRGNIQAVYWHVHGTTDITFPPNGVANEIAHAHEGIVKAKMIMQTDTLRQ